MSCFYKNSDVTRRSLYMVDKEEEFPQTTRIIGASLNRIGEGLHFLEEIARILLHRLSLHSGLQDIRQQLIINVAIFYRELLKSGKVNNKVDSGGVPVEIFLMETKC